MMLWTPNFNLCNFTSTHCAFCRGFEYSLLFEEQSTLHSSEKQSTAKCFISPDLALQQCIQDNFQISASFLAPVPKAENQGIACFDAASREGAVCGIGWLSKTTQIEQMEKMV